MIIDELLIIILLLAINAFFSLSEMSIVSAKKSLLKQYAQKGNKKALQVLELSEHPAKFLSTVQVGITLVGILAGAFGGATIAEVIGDFLNRLPHVYPHGTALGVGVVVSVITYLSVIFGELIPKQVALRYSETVAMFVSTPILLILKISYPFVYIFENSAKLFITLLGLKKSEEDSVTEAEIKALLHEGFQSGVIEKEEHEMLRRIIKLGDRDIKSIMTHRKEMVCIDVEDSVASIRAKIKQNPHSRYPLIYGDNMNILGFIESREILEACIEESQAIDIETFKKEPMFLPESTNCLSALDTLKKQRTQMAFVIDEYGSIEGIVTFLDILEAITGTLPSNYDNNDSLNIIQRDKTSWLVSGATPVEEMQILFEMEDIIDESSFETISGFLLHACNYAPREGLKIQVHNYDFEIVDIDNLRIDKILITKRNSAN